MFAPRYFAPRAFARLYYPVGGTSAAVTLSAASGANRFRSATVPPMEDPAEVQRFLQRTVDEMARAVNPLRGVKDGGTGLDEYAVGDVLVGAGPAEMGRVPALSDTTRRFLVSQGNGTEAQLPFFDVLEAGDIPGGGGGLSQAQVLARQSLGV